LFKTAFDKISKAWDDLFESIYKIFPFLRPEPEPTINVTVESPVSQNDIYPWMPNTGGGDWWEDPWNNTTNNLGADNQSSGRRF
jgi:hypothetical protein